MASKAARASCSTSNGKRGTHQQLGAALVSSKKHSFLPHGPPRGQGPTKGPGAPGGAAPPQTPLHPGGLRPPDPLNPGGLRPPDPLNSGGLRPPDPLRFWGLRPQTPMKCERGYGRGLTTKSSLWKPRQCPTQAIASHKPGPWRLRQQPTWLKSSNLACGGCDSSRL